MNAQELKHNLQQIIQKKPPVYTILSLLFALIVGLVKWRIHPTINTIFYMVGSVVGIYLFDVAESFFHLDPSPFRTIVFAGGFVLVSIFIISSSGSFLAAGLVLLMFFNILLPLWGEWQAHGNINSWFRFSMQPLAPSIQQKLVWVITAVFVLLTLYFIKSP